ncbi:MAG: deoxyribodipyrimidine photo-lyase, partial [Gammaproteobacteria bacterium]|nr:deoxyribodipyrimidine photo-lyase [Gammaproteobacteria bacterium]NIT64773.1 deoxyribodipyrimidine photo-lyase [Gammaproteobacteria bacterium]NIV21744.1 deoxyribodipyrimidine photo-lyase [Gammaproteobacteria bacterium]NIY33353.1 deoxyribodipyrimidine photo-lyase [Gammaproteobacteria bacterium]
MDTAIVWFRRDLRLADNPALRDALQRRLGIIPVYIHAPEEAAPWDDGGASRWWLYHSLTLLAESLRSRGSRLLIWEGPSLKALQALIAATGASHVFWNRRYEPALRTRDARIEKELNRAGVQCITCNAGLLFEPWTLSTGKGDPYRVFTPFWRACLRRGIDAAPLPAPSRLSAVDARLTSRSIESLGLRPAIPWDRGLTEQWEP